MGLKKKKFTWSGIINSYIAILTTPKPRKKKRKNCSNRAITKIL